MIDLVKLHVKAGNGGDGRLSFHRAKFMPKGGPDGGHGGDGGSIFLVGTTGMNTLNDFAGKKGFAAQPGEMGGKSNMFGKKGEDLYIEVPLGTVVWKVEEDLENFDTSRLNQIPKTKVADILVEGEPYELVKGGKGGRGNEEFKSSRNTTPMETEKGTPGEEMEVLFELKLLADVGLVGFPNAGKSTFLSLVQILENLVPNLVQSLFRYTTTEDRIDFFPA